MSGDLTSLFQPGDDGPQLKIFQGVIIAWDTDTAENTVSVAGGELLNVPSLIAETTALAAGDVVSLLSMGDRWLLLGKVTTPGDPDQIPSWNADLEALAPLVPIAELTTGTTITGTTQASSDTGPRVVVNDPAYPGEITLPTGDPDETEPARIKPIISGNIARLQIIGPKVTGMAGVPATFDLEANTTSAERQSAIDVDRFHLFSSDTTIDGFTQIRLGDGTDYITIVGQAVTDADLTDSTNVFLGRMLTQALAAAASGNTDLTAVEVDIAGASVTFDTTRPNALYMVTGSFYFSALAASATIANGKLHVDGVAAPGFANFTGTSTTPDRTNSAQSWVGTLAAAGTHTLKLRAVSGAAAVHRVNSASTTITVLVFE